MGQVTLLVQLVMARVKMIQKWPLDSITCQRGKFLFGDRQSETLFILWWLFPLRSEPLGIPVVAPEPHGVLSKIGGWGFKKPKLDAGTVFFLMPPPLGVCEIQIKVKWGEGKYLIWILWHPWLLLNLYLIPEFRVGLGQDEPLVVVKRKDTPCGSISGRAHDGTSVRKVFGGDCCLEWDPEWDLPRIHSEIWVNPSRKDGWGHRKV